jgi:predicted MFS family arabinose efflux permease
MLLFGADTITQLGTHVGRIALPLVAVLALNASPFETGLLIAAQTAAFLLIGLPAGAWVDRLPRRPILITSDLARAALFASVPIAWWLDALTLPHLYGVALGSGLATVFFDVAYQSYLPSLVDRDQLVDGNAKLEIIHSGAEVGGRGVGGWLVQLLGAPVAVLIDAVSFLGSALLLWRIDAVESIPDRAERRSLLKEIGEGLRFVLSHRILRMITACTAVSNFGSGIVGAVELIFLTRIVGLSPGVIGMLFAVAGIGGLVGATLIRPLNGWIGSARIIWVITIVTTPFALLTPFTAQGWGILFYAVSGFVITLGAVVYNVAQLSFRQAITPERMLGRMNASVRCIVWGALPLGGIVGGVLGEWVSVTTALWIGLAGGLVSVIPLLLSPLRTMRDLPTANKVGI